MKRDQINTCNLNGKLQLSLNTVLAFIRIRTQLRTDALHKFE